MPLYFSKDIDADTRLAVWHITEAEAFFDVPLQRSITHPHKRLQHVAGRYLLKWLFNDFPYSEILVATTRKPYLENERYHFSISHCGHYAAAIVSKTRRVGIDVELPASRLSGLAPKFLNDAEGHLLERMRVKGTEREATELLTIFWAAKEAMYKWWGRPGVDFRRMLLIEDLPEGEERVLQARLADPADPHGIALSLQYTLFESLVLVHTL
jgi:4'-phosphopantetheinyl transferase EntD